MLKRVLLIFAFIVFSAVSLGGIRWLLNQTSDILLILAALFFILYVWVGIQSKAFTKNPFKK